MNNIIAKTQENFESSSGKTPQYLTWHRQFRRAFIQFLQLHGATNIVIGKPNHFDASGFFTMPDGQIWYFSISDLRWSKDRMLIRTANSYKDYCGGSNQYISLANADEFDRQFCAIVLR